MTTSSDAKQNLPEQVLLRFLEIDPILRFIFPHPFYAAGRLLNADGASPQRARLSMQVGRQNRVGHIKLPSDKFIFFIFN
jgi:hypothetical protein